ncbi:MAG: hypothetical protein Q4E53_08540 [Eubacteriales bacterium]|nr:hypothetical protein [Eubacteriales bacterium]
MNKKTKGSWGLAFSIGATAFAAHAGGGFATGNQANNFFVSLGWISIFSAILAMVLLAFSVREGQIMWNTRGLKSYKELFAELFHPYDKISILYDIFYDIMILMVVASCIAGAASALNQYIGINYYIGAVVIGILILFLSIFGAELIRKSSTYMGTVILVLSITIYLIGIVKSKGLMATMSLDFANQGFDQLPKAILNGFTYAGFQWVTIPAVLACGTVLKTKSDCTKGMLFTLIFNCLGLGLSVLMLFSWASYYTAVENGTTIPTLTVLMNEDMGMSILVLLYVIVLFLCMISSGVAVVFGFINRFENASYLQPIKNTQVRRSAIAIFIMVISMGISFAGLTNVVKYGYGYCGYLGCLVAVLPLLTIGYYKNRKFLKENK